MRILEFILLKFTIVNQPSVLYLILKEFQFLITKMAFQFPEKMVFRIKKRFLEI
jgi:hypothetical protein